MSEAMLNTTSKHEVPVALPPNSVGDVEIVPTAHENGADNVPYLKPVYMCLESPQLKVRDLNHLEICKAFLNTSSGNIDAELETDATCYIDIGTGDEAVIATTPIDAQALYSLGIIKRAIAPLDKRHFGLLCKSLTTTESTKYLILGTHDLAHEISAAKRALCCRSEHPPSIWKNWGDFIAEEKEEKAIEYLQRNKVSSALSDYVVNQEHVENIENSEFIFPDLIIQGHIVVLVGEPNSGKTTISQWVCSQVSEVRDVHYINMDCSGGDLKYYQEYAQDHGFNLINFDITGTNDVDFFLSLGELPDLSNQLFIVDTLKKCADLMTKSSVKVFMKLLRTLCNRGGTFLLLAHTNKHKTKEGLPVFEGVGDIKSDCDELIYLIPQLNQDGSTTVSTVPDKTRGSFNPITFDISPDRSVSMVGHVDLLKAARSETDKPLLDAIVEAMGTGLKVQKDIVEFCREKGHGKNHALKTLAYYAEGDDILWRRSKGDKNAWHYQKLAGEV